MRLTWKLFVASLKMLMRQREAILWSLVLPLFMILLFSFVRFDGIGHINVGIVDEGAVGREKTLIAALRRVGTLELHEGRRDAEFALLEKGDRELVLVFPSVNPGNALEVSAFSNDAKPREAQLGALIIQQVMDEIAFQESANNGRLRLKTAPIKGRNLTYFDFVAPGILSMSIMQLGIFGVAFGFVAMKKRGILRRLSVTPVRPQDFIVAQVAMRLVLVMVQIGIMTLVPYLFLNLHFIGSFWELFLVGMLGAIVFLALGFAVAGIGKSEDQVAPLANIIAMPMMLLSGVFFSRSSLPGFIQSVVDYLPLSFLADAIRSIAIDGSTLSQVVPEIFGLTIWCLFSIGLAVRVFRWE